MAGTLAAIAMLVVGLWVVNQPRATVGQVADLSNEVALGVISAPQSGSLGRPVGSYAEAMSRTWSRLVEVPFAGLDFSDLKWALGATPARSGRKVRRKVLRRQRRPRHACRAFGSRCRRRQGSLCGIRAQALRQARAG